MTVLDEPVVEPRRRDRRRWYAAGAAAVVVIAAVTLITSINGSDPLHSFGERGGYASFDDVQVGQPIYVNLVLGEVPSIDIDSMHAAVRRDSSAPADVSVIMCEVRGSDSQGNPDTLTQACSRHYAFRPARYLLGAGDPRTEAFLAITPRATGTVRVDGVRVRYHRGERTGDQQAGVGVVLHVPKITG